MNFYRIFTLARRQLRMSFFDLDKLGDFLYWPLFDVLVWGFTGAWIQKSSGGFSGSVGATLLANIVLWHVAHRANLEVAYNFVNEIWTRNITNLFITPLSLTELALTYMLLGLINGIGALCVGASMAYALYGINIFYLSPLFILYATILLTMFGWCVGFFSASMLIRYGQRVQKIIWIMGWFFAPFSGVFYPMSITPLWVQYFASLLPSFYVFDGLQQFVSTGVFPVRQLLTSAFLATLYLSLILWLFYKMYLSSRKRGLYRLDID